MTFEILKNTIYINLEHRTDRLTHVLHQLQVLGIENPERFNAIKMKMGCIGCTMSHIKCLELAKSKGWPQVFICEDDIKFTNSELFLDKLGKFVEAGWEWDVLVVGGNNLPPFQQVSDFAVRVFDIQTTTGYIVCAHYYDILIQNFREGLAKLIREPERKKEFAVDIYWKTLQKTGNWFFLIPPSVIQYSDYSDIEDKVTNFEGHMLDLDKRAFIEYMMRLQQQKEQSKFSMF
jgi:GR25 family glycosyltransferase involved in LPS biosynthesis